MEKPEVHLVKNEGTVPEPLSAVSRDEEAHLLDLADAALHNEQPPTLLAGDHTRLEHQKLKQELQDSVERLENPQDPAA